ncbi:unnamed protein product [Agarophyton chilense]
MDPSHVPQADIAAVGRTKELFVSEFKEQPTTAVAAPGRVNLIGEHVDYNDGFVFPLALEKNTYLVGKALPVGEPCEVVAEAFPGVVAKFMAEDSPAADSVPKWARYLKGMTALYARKGYKVVPFRAAIASDVPLGSGLSSSAALEMAAGMMIEALGDLQVDATDRALMGQSCEHEFANVPCGIMDQLISSRGKGGNALLIDCRSLESKLVPLNDPNVVIVVANSCVEHELSGSEYPTRRAQCAAAAKAMAERFPGQNVTHLRDCTLEMLEKVKSDLDEDTVKRATHAISEDIRTLKAKKCLEEGDLVTAGKLMVESHESLRDLYEVSTEEIDALVEIALEVDGVYGSRITGGGFGGCTVTLVKEKAVSDLMKAFSDKYPAVSGGREAMVFATNAGSGARVLKGVL